MAYVTLPDWRLFKWEYVGSIYGASKQDVPRVVLKELMDNFLDAAGAQGVDPRIQVEISPDKDSKTLEIRVRANTHWEKERIELVFSSPFGSSVSSKNLVKLPNRGLFGQAMKVLQALPYTLAMEQGFPLPQSLPIRVETAYGGKKHVFSIGASVDERNRSATPVLESSMPGDAPAEAWTEVAVELPFTYDLGRWSIEKLMRGFLVLNPSLTLQCFVKGSPGQSTGGLPVKHRRVTPGRPAVLSYSPAQFKDALFAQRVPNPDMTVREFIQGGRGWRGFRGFQSEESIAEVLKAVGVDGETRLRDPALGSDSATRLFSAAVKRAERLRGRARLGYKDLTCLRGELAERLAQMVAPGEGGGARYSKPRRKGDAKRPWMMEAAVVPIVHRTSVPPEMASEIIVGVNGSPLLKNPFANYNLSSGRSKWASTNDLLKDLRMPVICAINISGLVEPLSPDKAEIDEHEYLWEYEVKICSLLLPYRKKRKGGPKAHSEMIDWLQKELERRKAGFKDGKPLDWVPQQSLWYKARNDYLVRRPGESEPDVSRKYFIEKVRQICAVMGVSREKLGIFAAERAILYFRGSRTGVSLESIAEVFKYGSDVIAIEKEGICVILEPLAAEYGIALLNSRGQLVDYAEQVIVEARKSGARVFLLTDMDDAGFVIANNLGGIARLGVDSRMIQELAREMGHATTDEVREFRKGIEEKANFYFTNLEEDQYLELGWTAKEPPSRKDQMTRIEIDAVLAFVGREQFWAYLLTRMMELAPERDLTRSLRDPAELAELALPSEVKEYVDHVRETFRAPIQRRIEKRFEGYRKWHGGFQDLEKLEGGIAEAARTEAETDTKALLPQMESEVRKVIERLGNSMPESG
ncbi:MAG: hypothetical protein JRN51_08110 [Nitrososphaerota archaeon]|nr:hypothetical protein [Nitrososphaerota archaeon]